MKAKKITSLLLACALVSGCGSSSKTQQVALVGAGVAATAVAAVVAIKIIHAAMRKEEQGASSFPGSAAKNKSAQWQQFQLGDSIVIIIPADNIFEAGTDRFTDKGKITLKKVSDILGKYQQKNILVTANTSGIGTPEFENALSFKQAVNVANYFSKHGVYSDALDDRKLYYSGLGSTQPIADQRLAEGIATNRRIQITLYNDVPENNLDKVDPIDSL